MRARIGLLHPYTFFFLKNFEYLVGPEKKLGRLNGFRTRLLARRDGSAAQREGVGRCPLFCRTPVSSSQKPYFLATSNHRREDTNDDEVGKEDDAEESQEASVIIDAAKY